MVPSCRICILLIFLIVLASGTGAIENLPIYKLEAVYKILPDYSVEETLGFTFDSPINKSLAYNLDRNASNISVSDGVSLLNYSILDGDEKYLNISLGDSLHRIIISYITKEGIFQKDSTSLFLTDFDFKSPVNKLDIAVMLPPGYSIYNNEFSPEDGVVSSNGSIITMKWSKKNVANAVSYSLRFYAANGVLAEKSQSYLVMSLAIAILIMGLLIFYIYRTFRAKTKENLLTGFREDEQKVLLYVQENKEVWQNKLRHHFAFSRAKTTRIIKRLEEQGIVRKVSYGKTNKVFWEEK